MGAVWLAGEHAQGRARCDALSQANMRIEAELDKERAAHGHAVRQYVTEVEARARLQAEGLEECNAKEHALFLQGAAEKRADKAQVRHVVNVSRRDTEACACVGARFLCRDLSAVYILVVRSKLCQQAAPAGGWYRSRR